jgi:hypothetical protein
METKFIVNYLFDPLAYSSFYVTLINYKIVIASATLFIFLKKLLNKETVQTPYSPKYRICVEERRPKQELADIKPIILEEHVSQQIKPFKDQINTSFQIDKPITNAVHKNISKNKLKGFTLELNDYLAEWEKDSLYSLLGLVNANNIKKDREFYIYSVEFLSEMKIKSERAYLKNLGINNQIKNQAESAKSLEDYQKILDLIISSIKNKLVIYHENYEKLILLSLE